MIELKIGCDVDGVLANFNEGYQNLLIRLTGKDKFRGEDYTKIDPPEWQWPKGFGYTSAQENAAWTAIKSDPLFWTHLRPYPFASHYLNELAHARVAGHAVYFITTRMGVSPQLQTAYWLQVHCFPSPHVLIADSHACKGLLAQGLGLTHFIDDKPENCVAVAEAVPTCRVSLLSRRYNEYFHDQTVDHGIKVIRSVTEFLQGIATYAKSH